MALLDGSARLPAAPALIVVDVDGTLLTSTHEVTSATAREVRRVRANGVDVLPASSRADAGDLPALRAGPRAAVRAAPAQISSPTLPGDHPEQRRRRRGLGPARARPLSPSRGLPGQERDSVTRRRRSFSANSLVA